MNIYYDNPFEIYTNIKSTVHVPQKPHEWADGEYVHCSQGDGLCRIARDYHDKLVRAPEDNTRYAMRCDYVYQDYCQQQLTKITSIHSEVKPYARYEVGKQHKLFRRATEPAWMIVTVTGIQSKNMRDIGNAGDTTQLRRWIWKYDRGSEERILFFERLHPYIGEDINWEFLDNRPDDLYQAWALTVEFNHFTEYGQQQWDEECNRQYEGSYPPF